MRPVRKWRRPHQPTPLKPANAAAERAIVAFSERRRNSIRGAVLDARRHMLTTETIDKVRANTLEQDMIAAATMLEAPSGLRRRKVFGLKQADIPLIHRLSHRSADLEIAYACGVLNAWAAESRTAIDTISVLTELTEVDVSDAIGALQKVAGQWGASNYLVYKISYLKEFLPLSEEDKRNLADIDNIIGHTQSPVIQYSAFENMKPTISIFAVARRYTNLMIDQIDGDFRRIFALNNLVSTPLSHNDCAGFVLRASETSLLDIVRSLWIILGLRSRLPEACAAIQRNLDADIWLRLTDACESLSAVEAPELCASLQVEAIVDDDESSDAEDRSLSYYRRAAAFLEFPALAGFRHDIDRVIGHRLIEPLLPADAPWQGQSFSNSQILTQPDGLFELRGHGCLKLDIDNFYRTYLFLRMIQDSQSLSHITSEEIQFIFNNTMRLDALLKENELRIMHINSSDEARALISVLALALYRSKSSDPDIDFDFRSNLEQYILQNFGGKIIRFIDDIAPRSPEVANYIVGSLDEVTLQKMYQIVGSTEAAESSRRDILLTVGRHLNKIEYIIEAEGIATRSKVAKLKSYFDASRMYVDSVAMRKWLSTNPSAYAEQYRELLPKIIAQLSASKSIVSSTGREATVGILEIKSTDSFLVERMAGEAFREFCINNEFGIESYLGRRIRHNTLHGVMTKSVDAVLQKPEYHPIVFGTPFGTALRTWESGYMAFIERIRKEFLQFRSESRPSALFSSEIDLSDGATKRNLQQLIQTLGVSGPDMLEELIITFCWRQIAPQLESASRQIRVKMTQDMTLNLDQALARFNGPEEVKIKSALTDSVSSVFAQVASWFQVPQTGFVPASISDISNIVDIEHGRSSTPTRVIGEIPSIKYYGISVHRLYDCLAVLLGNAFKHGRPGTDVTVRVTAMPIINTNLHSLSISVQSMLPKDGKGCVERVSAALTSVDTGRDMVTEGYSGIKKVKFITRLNEGEPTVSFDLLDELIEVRFTLKAEVADSEGGIDENSPG